MQRGQKKETEGVCLCVCPWQRFIFKESQEDVFKSALTVDGYSCMYITRCIDGPDIIKKKHYFRKLNDKKI